MKAILKIRPWQTLKVLKATIKMMHGEDESFHDTQNSDTDRMDNSVELESDFVNDTNNDPTFRSRANTDNGYRSSSRNRKPFQPFQWGHFAFMVEQYSELETKNVSEAINGENSEKWIAAMNEEIEAHKENETWQLTKLLSNHKAISAKLVFKVKAIGTHNERFKAQLVARGYAQVPGIDFDETFSPVARHTSLRILFEIAIRNNMRIFQMDAITAFL